MRGSLATRLTVAGVSAGTLIAASVAALLLFSLDSELDSQKTAVATEKARYFAHLVSEQPDAAALSSNPHPLQEVAGAHAGMSVAVAAPDDRIIFAHGAHAVSSVHRHRTDAGDRRPTKGTALVTTSATGITARGEALRVFVTMDDVETRDFFGALLKRLASIGLIVVGIVALGTLWFVRAGMAPLERLARIVGAINSRNLTPRFATAGEPIEIMEVGRAVNLMLDRIEDGMTRLTQVSGDLAHELRTPVAVLLGEMQVALLSKRTVGDLRSVLVSSVEEVQRLARILEDILFLARVEESRLAVHMERLDMVKELGRVIEFLEGTAQDRGIVLEVDGSGCMSADRQLTERILINLLSNALQHAPSESNVEIRMAESVDGSASITVRNRGKPIPSPELSRIFDRFFRASNAPTCANGTGLGMAIAATAMNLQGGSVVATSDATEGTTFTLYFRQSGEQER